MTLVLLGILMAAPAPIKLPPLAESTLPNGLRIVVAERHALPLMAARLLLSTGSARDPTGKEGLAQLTGDLLRRGTTQRSAAQIDDTIERVGGLLDVDVARDSTELAVSVPAAQLEVALDVMADVAVRPSFAATEFETVKRRALAELARELDDPAAMADRVAVTEGYGATSPYGHPVRGSQRSVGQIVRDDVVAFHKRGFSPKNAVLFLVGDIRAQDAAKLAATHFGSWSGDAMVALTVPQPLARKRSVVLLDKADASQAQIRIVAPGLTETSPDWESLAVAATVLGGGFTSILVDEVRVNRGLSYNVGCRFHADRDAGLFVFSSFTKNATLRELSDLALKLIAEFRAHGPSDAQLEKAQRYMSGLYPLHLETNEQLAAALADAVVKSLPFERVADFPVRIAAVTAIQARAAALKYLPDNGETIVIVGQGSALEPQLKGLAEITRRPITSVE